jgi:hypothetical protein
VTIGLAVAPTADSRVTMAVNAAIRTTLMVPLVSFSRSAARRNLTPGATFHSRPRLQNPADLVFQMIAKEA